MTEPISTLPPHRRLIRHFQLSRCYAGNHRWRRAQFRQDGAWSSDEACTRCGARRWWPQ
jgi:hypothetical protein